MRKSLLSLLALILILFPLLAGASGVRGGGGGSGGNVSNSGTPALHQFGIWYDSTHAKGVTVAANKALCTDANGEPMACVNLLDAAIPVASTTTPLMDGVADQGIGTAFARSDHRHGADTSKAPVANPYLATNVGLGVGAGSGFTVAGTSLSAGSVYYMSGTVLTPAKADAAATTPAICIASSATACMYNGVFRLGASPGWAIGVALYLSDTVAGGLTQVVPATAGHFVQRVGIALAADTVLMMPALDVGQITP